MIKSQKNLKYINHQKILIELFTVPHLELIQGRPTEEGQLCGRGNITCY